MSLAKDIAKRFELLENQWVNFQKRAASWEVAKEPPLSPSSGLLRCSSSVQGGPKTSNPQSSSPVPSLCGVRAEINNEASSECCSVPPAVMQEEAIKSHYSSLSENSSNLEPDNSSFLIGKSSYQVNLETCSESSHTLSNGRSETPQKQQLFAQRHSDSLNTDKGHRTSVQHCSTSEVKASTHCQSSLKFKIGNHISPDYSKLPKDPILNIDHGPNGMSSQLKLFGHGSHESRHYSLKERATTELLSADAFCDSGSMAFSSDKGVSYLRTESSKSSSLPDPREFSPMHQSRSPPDSTSSQDSHLEKFSCNELSFTNSNGQRCLQSRYSIEHKSPCETERNSELEYSHASFEDGVMQKLCSELKNVLSELEKKESFFVEARKKFKASLICTSDGMFHFEQEKIGDEASLDGLSILVEKMNSENWSQIIENVCQRLITFFKKETYLQRWAVLLEKEALRLLKLEEEVIEAKASISGEKEKATIAMRKAEEHYQNAKEEHLNLVKERESLVHWVTHLQERREAVTECEREAALSLVEVQKRVAELFVRESHIDEKTLEISALQDKLKLTAQRLEDDEELLAKEQIFFQEKMSQLEAKDKEIHSQMMMVKRMQQDLDIQREQYKMENLTEEKIRDTTTAANSQWEERLIVKEKALKEQEISLEEKVLEAEIISQNLVARERQFNALQKKIEEERQYNQLLLENVEKERMLLQEVSREAEYSRKKAEDLSICASQEREDVSECMQSIEEKFKEWENRLIQQEEIILQKQSSMKVLEKKLHKEQDQCHLLHSKLIQEQEAMKTKIASREESLTSRAVMLDVKENEINKEFERLGEERKLALQDLKRLTEMEAKIQVAETNLQSQKQEHIQEYEMHLKDLDTSKQNLYLKRSEVERRFEEVQIERQELKIWQREAEESLERQIKSLIQENEEIHIQNQELKYLQVEIEHAGAQMINHMKDMDGASTKLESQWRKIDTSHKKLELLSNNIARKQLVLKDMEKDLMSKEENLKVIEDKLMRTEADAIIKEKSFKIREQVIMNKEKDLHVLTEAKQPLKMGMASFYTSTQMKNPNFEKDKLSIKELDALKTEKNLTALEADLNNREQVIDEKSCLLSKLELEVNERLHKVEQLENIFLELENGWRKLREEENALVSQKGMMIAAKSELQKQQSDFIKQKNDHQQQTGTAWRERLRNEVEKHYQEMLELTTSLRARDSALANHEEEARDGESVLNRPEPVSRSEVQMEKNLQKLQEQVATAHMELEAQMCYSEQERKAAEVTAASLQQREIKLRQREQEMMDREKILKMLEAKINIFSEQVDVRSTHLSLAGSRKTNYLPIIGALNMFEETPPKILVSDKQDEFNPRNLVSELPKYQATHSQPVAASQEINHKTKQLMLSTEQFEVEDGRHEVERAYEELPRLGTFGENLRFQQPEELEFTSSFVPSKFTGEKKAFNLLDCYRSLPKSYGNQDNSFSEQHTPSKARLENVMTSLLNAREASRSRLHRTENAVLSLPPSCSSTLEVKKALDALAARLSVLDQIEEGLASQLRKSYESDTPHLEGIIIDKVQLLCRMEEQQTLRAEWEEDMQQQLEKISILQAAFRESFLVQKQGTPYSKDFSPLAISKVGGCVDDEELQERPCTRLSTKNAEIDRFFSVSGDATLLSEYPRHINSPEWNMSFEVFPEKM